MSWKIAIKNAAIRAKVVRVLSLGINNATNIHMADINESAMAIIRKS